MALQIFASSSTGPGLRANLTTADSVFVASGVTVGSTDNSAISGTGSNHIANIQGSVVGNYDTIKLGDDSTIDSGQRLIVGDDGYIGQFSSGAYGAWIRGFNSTVENSGTIWSANVAIVIQGTSASSQSELTNTGIIEGKTYGILRTGTETFIVQNSGTLKAGSYAFYSDEGIDQITNTGKIIGDVFLGSGNDIFDTKLGLLSGSLNAGAGTDTLHGSAAGDTFNGGDDADTIYGYAGNDKLYGDNGNDTMTGGAGADVLDGGAGIDRASYASATTGVLVSLTNPTLNSGEAKGDTFSGIENLAGSNYNDSLFGNSAANAIGGGSGNDTIRGYAGLDRLTGNSGNDSFVFDTALNATTNVDTITDYNVVADTIQLENAIFTTLTATGVLAATAFVKNAAGVAGDSSDRIVYETDTGKLFYDRDGNGAAFAGIQFATLTPGLALTNADFFII